MKKDEMKQTIDKHVASCNGEKDKRKGFRPSAWEECKTLELLMKGGVEA